MQQRDKLKSSKPFVALDLEHEKDDQNSILQGAKGFCMPKKGSLEYILAGNYRFRDYEDVKRLCTPIRQMRRQNWFTKFQQQLNEEKRLKQLGIEQKKKPYLAAAGNGSKY